MFKQNHPEKSKMGKWTLILVNCILLNLLAGYSSTVLAQEISEMERQAVMMQYTLKYRFGHDLQVGDWVRYEQIADEGEEPEIIELKVVKEDGGKLWIQEKFHGNDINYLIDPDKMKLVKVTGTDPEGEKQDFTGLSEDRYNEAMTMFKAKMEQQGAFAQFVAWVKTGESETTSVPAGSFNCTVLKPKYSSQYAQQVEGYRQSLKQQGKSEAEIEAALTQAEPRLYFGKDVPRLLPMTLAMGWLPWIEAFEEVPGGLVAAKHMAPIQLVEYSK